MRSGPCRFLHTNLPRRFPNALSKSARSATPPSHARSGSEQGRSSTSRATTTPNGLLAGGGLLAALVAFFPGAFDVGAGTEKQQEHARDHGQPPSNPTPADNRDPSLPRFRLSDVRKHDKKSGHPWVTHKDKVYDITDWVAAHPGGDVILRAAGASIEPYWNIFSIHKQQHVRDILDQYLIGFIHSADLVEGRPAAEQVKDLFVDDPLRDGRLVTHTLKPRNAEPPTEELDRDFHTPNELFYVRNHMWVPVVADDKMDEHRLTIELPDGETRQYTLAELKTRFPVHKLSASLQCSGNRRNDMSRQAGKTNGLQWGVGAISNAEWEGVRLSDVLADAGLKVASPAALTKQKDPSSDPSRGHPLTAEVGRGGARFGGGDGAGDRNESMADPRTHHVQLSGLEAYGASIPLSKALDPSGDVLLAFGMNGRPLPRDHGLPLRAVVPGYVAARSVKWLSKVVVSDEESHSQWQRRDYKCFGPNEGPSPNWDRAPAIQEMPVTSAITRVAAGECVRRGKIPWVKNNEVPGQSNSHVVGPTEPIAMQGYAYSGGGREITRVDISVDGGRTWNQAELLDGSGDGTNHGAPREGNRHWAWKRWRYAGQLPVPPEGESRVDEDTKQSCATLVVKATDEAYNAQPESHAGIYNVRGNLATAWHRVRICPKCAKVPGGGVVWSTGDVYGCGFQKEEDDAQHARGKTKKESAT